jgi:hypothetical protein
MSKRLVWALVLLAVAVVVIVFNRGSTSVDLPLTSHSLDGLKAVVFLAFLGIGVAVGLLLK